MMVENADLPAWHGHFIEKIRHNAIDPDSQVQELSFS